MQILVKSIKSFSLICGNISKFQEVSDIEIEKSEFVGFLKALRGHTFYVFYFCIIFFIFISLCNVSIISTSCLKSKLYASNNYFGYTKYSWNQPKNEFSVFCIMWPKMKKKLCSICQKFVVKLVNHRVNQFREIYFFSF